MNVFCKISRPKVQCGACEAEDDCFHHSVFPQRPGEVTQTQPFVLRDDSTREKEKTLEQVLNQVCMLTWQGISLK